MERADKPAAWVERQSETAAAIAEAYASEDPRNLVAQPVQDHTPTQPWWETTQVGIG